MGKVRGFRAFVSFEEAHEEESFPIRASSQAEATTMALLYASTVLKLDGFTLRVVGA